MSDKKKAPIAADAAEAQLIEVDDFDELPTLPYVRKMLDDRRDESSGDLGLAMLAAAPCREDGP